MQDVGGGGCRGKVAVRMGLEEDERGVRTASDWRGTEGRAEEANGGETRGAKAGRACVEGGGGGGGGEKLPDGPNRVRSRREELDGGKGAEGIAAE